MPQKPYALLICLLLSSLYAFAASAQASLPVPPADKAGTTSILLSFTGDCVLGGEEKTRKDKRSFDNMMDEKGLTWPFSGFEELFAQDDITLANLECVLQDSAKGRLTEKTHTFRGCTGYAEILNLGGVEVVNVANNHFIDYGAGGRANTLQALQTAGVAYSGYGELHTADVRGKRIGFGGIRETVYKQHPETMAQDIQKLKEMGCDAIIYSCHFGKEYSRTHNTLQEEMARNAIDLGANLVVGHHPHVVQGVENYNGGVILYSLGNFIFGGNLNLTEFDAYVAQAELFWNGETYQGMEIRLIPVLTTGIQPANDFRPIPAQGEDKARILAKIQDDSGIPIREAMYFPK